MANVIMRYCAKCIDIRVLAGIVILEVSFPDGFVNGGGEYPSVSAYCFYQSHCFAVELGYFSDHIVDVADIFGRLFVWPWDLIDRKELESIDVFVRFAGDIERNCSAVDPFWIAPLVYVFFSFLVPCLRGAGRILAESES